MNAWSESLRVGVLRRVTVTSLLLAYISGWGRKASAISANIRGIPSPWSRANPRSTSTLTMRGIATVVNAFKPEQFVQGEVADQ